MIIIMNNIKRYLFVIFIVSLFILFLIIIIKNPFNNCLETIDYLSVTWKVINIIIFFDMLLIFIFLKYLWKLKFFKHWLVIIPNIDGVWEGVFTSSYENKKGNIRIKFKQWFTHISYSSETEESNSKSTSCKFIYDDSREEYSLQCLYINIPSSIKRDNSPINYGAIIFDNITENKILKGRYWTDRKSIGDIEIKKIK